MSIMKLAKLRKEVVQVCMDCVKNGLFRNIGVSGNVSARDPESGLIALTPSQVRYDTMGPGDIIVVDMKGKIVESKRSRKPTTESPTHILIYQRFEEVNAIVHTHSIYANVLGTLRDEIPTVYVGQAYFVGGAVPVSEYVSPHTEDMARLVAEYLKDSPCMVIRNHGLITVGKNLGEALQRAVVVEDNSKIFHEAYRMRKPELFPEEEIQKFK